MTGSNGVATRRWGRRGRWTCSPTCTPACCRRRAPAVAQGPAGPGRPAPCWPPWTPPGPNWRGLGHARRRRCPTGSPPAWTRPSPREARPCSRHRAADAAAVGTAASTPRTSAPVVDLAAARRRRNSASAGRAGALVAAAAAAVVVIAIPKRRLAAPGVAAPPPTTSRRRRRHGHRPAVVAPAPRSPSRWPRPWARRTTARWPTPQRSRVPDRQRPGPATSRRSARCRSPWTASRARCWC